MITLTRGLARNVTRPSTLRGLVFARGFAAKPLVTTRLVKNDDVSEAERKRMANVLAESFLSYPEHTDMWSKDQKITATLVESAVNHTLNKQHKVWVAEKDNEVVGVCLWTDPGKVWFTEEEVPAVFGPVLELLDPKMIEFLISVMLPVQGEMEERVKPGMSKEWSFGAMLGVDPKLQGYGVGGQLMRETIKSYGDTPIALHTQGQKNLRFYGNLGFKVRNEHDFVLPSGKVWDDHLMVLDKESKAWAEGYGTSKEV